MGGDRPKAEKDNANGELGCFDQEMERYEGDSQPTDCKYDQCDFRSGWLPPFVEAMENIRVHV